MKKAFWFTMITAIFMSVSMLASPVFASIPVLDGVVTDGDEWAFENLHTFVTDPNEGDIPDSYDFASIMVQHVTGVPGDIIGGDPNGLYIRFDTYDTPTLEHGPNGFGEAFITLAIDFDGDGVADLFASYNGGVDAGQGLLGFYDSAVFNMDSLIGYGEVAMDEIIEMFIPDEIYLALGLEVGDMTGFRARYDDNGDNPDDSIPDEGFTTPIPEPATLGLMGMGLLGLLGFRFKRKV